MQAVDIAGIDLDACWEAPPSTPCTDACKVRCRWHVPSMPSPALARRPLALYAPLNLM